VKAKAAGLPRQARLSEAGQYAGRFSERLQGHWYQVLARPNHLPGARLGLIVGRRAAARAVDRSLAKRLAREEFRRVRTAIPGWDVVVRLKAGFARGERVAARTELRELLARLGK
jgi:ribonuclease P protein component